MKLNLKTFLDTHAEWEAFSIGWAEVLCPWPPRFQTVDWHILEVIWTEYHYYQFGRATGILSWLGLVALLKLIIT